MGMVKYIYSIIIMLVIGITLILAFTPLLKQFGQSGLVPLLWILVILGVISTIVVIFKKLAD